MSLGLILAGGRSRRFGGEKAAATLAGRSLLEIAHARLAVACAAVAVSARAGSRAEALARRLGATALDDPPGAPPGPLAGVLAGLDWASGRGEGLLAVLPCDAPLVPGDLVVRLLAEIGDAPAAVARSSGGVQPLCAVWRTRLAAPLRAALAEGAHPPVHELLAEMGVVFVDFPDDRAFLNVNTPQDLAEAERLLSAR